MPWSYDNYPASLKNLTAEVRRKAIDIANALLDEGCNEGRSIAIATAQAEKWAKRRDKKIRKENAVGSTGQAVASDDGDGEPIHVLPNPKNEGWIAIQKHQRIVQGKDKGDVMNKVRERAKSQHTQVYIHGDDDEIIDEEDYS